jgi:hypothetical protein
MGPDNRTIANRAAPPGRVGGRGRAGRYGRARNSSNAVISFV